MLPTHKGVRFGGCGVALLFCGVFQDVQSQDVNFLGANFSISWLVSELGFPLEANMTAAKRGDACSEGKPQLTG